MLSLLFSGADILDKARNSTVSDPHTQRHCCYFSNVVLLMEDLFCSFSAHKRFTELLSKEEKDLANVRAPMDRILTLPELKVRSNDTVSHQKCVSIGFINCLINKDSSIHYMLFTFLWKDFNG